MTPDATAISALGTAVVTLAGLATLVVKRLIKELNTMGKQLKELQAQGQQGPSSPCGTDTNPGTGEGCVPLQAMKEDLGEVKADVKKILWHMVNGHK